ncbi:hypothetical protein BGZ63DRAFT_474832 [Mariannaea sp. PMI_226]|nr:hypothetical protein BGZ63DRAFT_474832 [Mariannaea sp. PMI_226]
MPPAPIAIVGMSCRVSGDTLISRSRDGWAPIPTDRFSSDAYYHPNPQKMGCFNQKGGYFMRHNLSKFDAPFFHVTEQEAIAMDPQQRQLLECAYEALENAGFPKTSIAKSNMGVFVGGRTSDYRVGALRDLNQVPVFDATGNHSCIQAGRISYYFDLHGPCFTVDTACSSSLHALHLAVQSIRSGESESAIVAGCNVHLQPDDMVSMSMLGIFNNDGKTYAFDHRAKSGYARGEGIGCLILKPLEKALEDNDKIRSIIVNTRINQDGKTIGITAPSGDAQERLIREVYARAHISPEQTGFIETHGAGTKAGDPIEAEAIYRVFGNGRTKRSPLYIGSVKTNFGHLENASGIISIIKATLMLERGFILPNVNFEKANGAIPLDEWNMKVPIGTRPWPKDKRFISVNNFGIGGSTAHVVLERPPHLVSEFSQNRNDEFPQLVVLSANDEDAAKRVASRLSIYIEKHPAAFQKGLWRDICYTLGERRTHLPWRIALTATSCDELGEILTSTAVIPRRISGAPKLAFIYNGQGTQWPQMGQDLMETHPLYARTIKVASDYLKRLGADFSLTQELSKSKEESNMSQAHISQPACTAIQLGLTVLLSSWGVTPTVVVGHSSGEIAAAFAAGGLSIEEAMTVAYHRGQSVTRMKTKYPDLRGAMIAVGAGSAEVKGIIKRLGLGNITVACENSPSSVTVSGDEVDIDALRSELEVQGLFNRKLRVDIGYHSSHMQLATNDYMTAIKDMTPKPKQGDVAFYSALLGARSDKASFIPQYWVDNLTMPVLFSSALHDLCVESEPDIIIEIGPHSALEGPVKQITKSAGQPGWLSLCFPSLVRNQHATISMLNLAGNLFVHGHVLDFGAVNQTDDEKGQPVVISDFLPYPWSDHRYWSESRSSKQHRLKPFARHDLLGLLEDTYSESEPIWRNMLSLDDLPWLKDHRMQSLTVFPLAGYLCMAVEAASQRVQLRGANTQQICGYRLRDVQANRAMVLDDGVQYETMVSMKAYSEGTRSHSNHWDEFRISSWEPNRGWIGHCRGLIRVKTHSTANLVTTVKESAASLRFMKAMNPQSQPVALKEFYNELENHGASYRSVFTLKPEAGLMACENFSTSTIAVPDTMALMPSSYETPSILPAAFTDLLLQHIFPILGAGRGEMLSLFMPSAINELDISDALPNHTDDQMRVVAHGCPDPRSLGPVDFYVDVWHRSLVDPVIRMTGLKMTPVRSASLEDQNPRSLCYRIEWQPLTCGNGESTVNGEMTNIKQEANVKTKANDKSEANGGSEINGKSETNGESTRAAESSGINAHIVATTDCDNVPVILISDKNESQELILALEKLVEQRTGSIPSVSSLSTICPSPNECYICLAEVNEQLLHNISREQFASVQSLLLNCSSILWVTVGAYRFAEKPRNNIAQGLLRTVRSEVNVAAATLDLDPDSQLDVSERAELILRAFNATVPPTISETGSGPEYELAEEAGELVVPRVVQEKDLNLTIFRETQSSASSYPQDFEQPGRRLKMDVGTPGTLDSLYWEDEDICPLNEDEIEIKIAATGMNFKDVSSPYFVSRVGRGVDSFKVGDRAYGTYAHCAATSAVIIPATMSFEVAASIPVVYCTAYYGIIYLARMEPGEKILIHAGSGGVGQATIQLAQSLGAEIYVTVGSMDKKQFLVDTYAIPEERIFYSRDSDFGPVIREATDGKGVDVIINSLAGDLLHETWKCLAPFGRFIEIGKRDILSNTRLEMAKFASNCTFSSVDSTLIAAERPKIMTGVLATVMDLLSKQIIHPIGPITTVGISEVEIALRKLQSGKTTGKIVVSHSIPNEQVKATHPTTRSVVLWGDATYLIIGGTGGIGRSIARRLVLLGARHIVLLSRKGAVTNEIRSLVQECKDMGASIYIEKCDATDYSQVRTLIEGLEKSLPPIRGLIHAAMVLKDVLFENMNFDDYDAVLRSKVDSAQNFHIALINAQLDFFVMLSSVAGIVGNKGQGAYAAANTFLDAFALYRRRKGLAATSLNLAAIGGIGYLAENPAKQAQVLQNLSGSTMSESELLALIEVTIKGKVGAICGGQCITGLDFSNSTALPYYAVDARFSRLRDEELAKLVQHTNQSQSASLTISQKLSQAIDLEQALETLIDGLRDKLAAILMIPVEVLSAQKATTSITAFGLDSLTAIELRNWIGKELQAHLQVLELLKCGLLRDLAVRVLKETRLVGIWSQEDSKTTVEMSEYKLSGHDSVGG